MCGLVGVFGNLSINAKQSLDIFHDLLIVGQLRGTHSTGVAKIRKSKGKPLIHKVIGDPTCLFIEQSYEKMIKDEINETLGYIGHNRFATKGDISKQNAHPFKHKNICLTHNGTVWETGGNKQLETDSEQITHLIAEKGIAETWEKIRGAAALVWWDSAEKSLNMLRNNERPLVFGRTTDGRLFWSSEVGMLKWILQRKDFPKIEINKGFFTPKPNYLFTWKFENNKLIETGKELKAWEYSGENSNWYERGRNSYVPGPYNPQKHNDLLRKPKIKTSPFEVISFNAKKAALDTYDLKRPMQCMEYNSFISSSINCANCDDILCQKDWTEGIVTNEESKKLICKQCADLFFVIGFEALFSYGGVANA